MKNITDLIQKHGKQLVEELLDLIIINNKIDNSYLRSLLLKHKVIKPTTKTIVGNLYKNKKRQYINGRFQETDDMEYKLSIRNGKNQTILYLSLKQSNLPEVFNMLNNCS